MTVTKDLTLYRGDADDITITLAGINLSQATDGTAGRPSIIRLAAKKNAARDSNAKAILLKTTYVASEIEILTQSGATLGKAVAYIDKPDTSDEKAGAFTWDAEITRQGALRSGASVGTAAIVGGAVALTGTGTAFALAKPGDVIQPTSGANVGLPSLITAIASNAAATVERSNWTTDPSMTFEIRRGVAETIAAGAFTLSQDVVL